MITIIHDLEEKDLNNLQLDDSAKIVNSNNCNNTCIGCFSCWVKHPKICAYNDEFSNLVESIKKSQKLVLISKCRYGCYSSKVKRVLERCIGYVLPYFTERNGEMHHKCRYNNSLKLIAVFYGDVSEEEKSCARKLVKANGINLNTESNKAVFISDIKELKNVYFN